MKIEDKRKLIKLEQQYFEETKYYKARLKWEAAKKLNPDTPCPPECQNRIINLSTKKNKKRFRPYEIEKYLEVLKLKNQDLKLKDIINKLGVDFVRSAANKEKMWNISNIEREFKRYLRHAKNILQNVEEGKQFPGKY